jgi:hypothetical protein
MALLLTNAMNFELSATAMCESPSSARWSLQDATRNATDCSPYWTHLERKKKSEFQDWFHTRQEDEHVLFNCLEAFFGPAFGAASCLH